MRMKAGLGKQSLRQAHDLLRGCFQERPVREKERQNR